MEDTQINNNIRNFPVGKEKQVESEWQRSNGVKLKNLGCVN